MTTFYFNTGVKPHNCLALQLFKGQVLRGGTIQIPFDCENMPENATFLYACDDPDSSMDKSLIVREIHNSSLISKFAFFRDNN